MQLILLNRFSLHHLTSMDDAEESPGDTGVESFSLEDDQSNEPESNGNQRTSTPTKNITCSEDELVITDGQLLKQGNVLSPVLNSGAETTTPIHDQQSSSYDQTFLSLREHSTQENSGDESQSLYTSALSNVNVTVTSDSCSMLEGKSVEARRALDASFEVTLHHDQSPGESSTQDSTWATAHGSFQDDSDLKDVTIKQELGQSNLSSEPQDEIVDDSDYEDDSVIKSSEASQDVSESTCQDKAATEHWRNGVMENSDRTTTSEEINSPDLDLLNEICEEATNMTIKEALICSLNPGVRAGLREGRLSMNESEILALEQYCEQFIDNLISQLLAGQWSESMNNAAYRPLDSKAKVAKKLSMLDLETLKSNCDRFVHSIITESLHNFCFGFQIKDTNLPGSDTEFNAKQNALDQKSVQDLLPIFKQSEAIQDYIGFLAADVVKSALANLSTSIATKNGEKNEQMILNNNSTSHDKTSIQGIVCSSKDKQDVQGTNTNNDMRKSYGNFTASGGIENETNRDAVSTGSDDDFELQYVRETEELSEDEQMFSSSLTGALETSLEFDHDVGDWEGGGLLAELHSMNTVTG